MNDPKNHDNTLRAVVEVIVVVGFAVLSCMVTGAFLREMIREPMAILGGQVCALILAVVLGDIYKDYLKEVNALIFGAFVGTIIGIPTGLIINGLISLLR